MTVVDLGQHKKKKAEQEASVLLQNLLADVNQACQTINPEIVAGAVALVLGKLISATNKQEDFLKKCLTAVEIWAKID